MSNRHKTSVQKQIEFILNEIKCFDEKLKKELDNLDFTPKTTVDIVPTEGLGGLEMDSDLINDEGAIPTGTDISYIVKEILEAYIEPTVSVTKLTSGTLEKGVSKSLSWRVNYDLGTDTLQSSNWYLDNALAGAITGSGDVLSASSEFTITAEARLSFEILGAVSRSGTYSFYTPQWRGVSTSASVNTGSYSALNSALDKFVQSSDNTTLTANGVDMYAYFISTNSNATIKDSNGFDNTQDFQKSTVTVKLANGDSQTMYMYRTKQKNTFNNFKYILS